MAGFSAITVGGEVGSSISTHCAGMVCAPIVVQVVRLVVHVVCCRCLLVIACSAPLLLLCSAAVLCCVVVLVLVLSLLRFLRLCSCCVRSACSCSLSCPPLHSTLLASVCSALLPLLWLVGGDGWWWWMITHAACAVNPGASNNTSLKVPAYIYSKSTCPHHYWDNWK